MLAVSTKTKGVILRGCQSKIVKTLDHYRSIVIDKLLAYKLPPLWLLISGDTGTGKSTLASELRRVLRAVFVDLRDFSSTISLETLISRAKTQGGSFIEGTDT